MFEQNWPPFTMQGDREFLADRIHSSVSVHRDWGGGRHMDRAIPFL